MIYYKEPIYIGFNVELSDLDLCYIYMFYLFFFASPQMKRVLLSNYPLSWVRFIKSFFASSGPNETLYETHFGGVVYVDQSVLFGSGSDLNVKIQNPSKIKLFYHKV